MHCRRWVRVRNCQKCTTRNACHFFILFGSFHFLPPHSAMVLCGIATKGLLWWKFDILKMKNLILPLPALKIATPQKFLESTLTHFRVCWGISSSRFNLLVSSAPLLTIMLVFTLCWQYCNARWHQHLAWMLHESWSYCRVIYLFTVACRLLLLMLCSYSRDGPCAIGTML